MCWMVTPGKERCQGIHTFALLNDASVVGFEPLVGSPLKVPIVPLLYLLLVNFLTSCPLIQKLE